jgi:hypothetical protein
MEDGGMIWRDVELKTIGDLMKYGIDTCSNREEAEEFMRVYRAECEHADENIGYLSGYYGPEEMQRIQDWFGVAHPFFGRSVPSPEEAFAMGKKWAQGERSTP